MVRDPLSGDDPPDLQSVLDALDDPDCRTIIQHLDEPMTATEVSEECDIPMSTTYRKLDLLTEASLLAEGTEIRPDGHHATRYELDFDRVEIGLTEEQKLEVSVGRPARTADERLASLWGEVRKET
ncbi:winged helix-turn-helix domain-containing protein [Haloplanus aerogenes]|uniref:ArsR family transcriptional regulator n=1 Tax=Haloplanus aerogenes TaxID=660522 RepID=A0A3M0DSZ6_9EURY|nr:helix-turn-helix domain-containing protein [Haloplanus aerogenes]AZH26098.1 ArsR family transcriptional regulator [Haloplanus aerogenes]RMB18453.1 helix-turn-helix protein [Haloplanus aerogenes]